MEALETGGDAVLGTGQKEKGKRAIRSSAALRDPQLKAMHATSLIGKPGH